MRVIIAVFVTVLALALLAGVGLTTAEKELVGEKHGRVVDSMGTGVSGADIFIMWDEVHRGLGGTDAACVLQKTAITDASGYFNVPRTASELSWLTRAMNSRSRQGVTTASWRIAVYKSGLLEKSTVIEAERAHYLPRVRFAFQPGESMRAANIDGGIGDLGSIPLVADTFDTDKSITYFSHLIRALKCPGSGSELPSMAARIYADAVPRITKLLCALPPDHEVAGSTVSELANLVDGRRLNAELKETGIHLEDRDRKSYRAAALCAAMAAV